MAMSRSLGVRSLTTSPSIRISPSVSASSPANIRRTVVLPHPDGPTRIMNSPSRISRSKSWTAAVSPKRFATPLKTISATGSSPPPTLRPNRSPGAPLGEELLSSLAQRDRDRPVKRVLVAQQTGLDPGGNRREGGDRRAHGAKKRGVAPDPAAQHHELRVDDRADGRNRHPDVAGDPVDDRVRGLTARVGELEDLPGRSRRVTVPVLLSERGHDPSLADRVLERAVEAVAAVEGVAAARQVADLARRPVRTAHQLVVDRD